MPKQTKRFGQPVRTPSSTRAAAGQIEKAGFIDTRNAARAALQHVFGEEFDKIFPGSIQVSGDRVTARYDSGGEVENVAVSLSKKIRL